MAGQRILDPLIGVRIPAPEPLPTPPSVGPSVGDPVIVALEAGLDDARARRAWTDVARLAAEIAGRTKALESVVYIGAASTRRR